MKKKTSKKEFYEKSKDYGRHEVLDRTALAICFIESSLIHHYSLEKDEQILARQAFMKLSDLYFLIGKRHLK